MEILRAFQIARREWENIKSSLEMCGDIGEFHSKNHAISKPAVVVVSEGLLMVRNVIGMENKLPIYGYSTPEAARVFTALASKAGKRLGLMGGLTQTFGRGYSWVRTGCFDLNGIENQHVMKQMIFFKLFFPLKEDLKWDFNSAEVKTKLKLVFDKFVLWQDMPKSFTRDVRRYKNQIENLFGSAYH